MRMLRFTFFFLHIFLASLLLLATFDNAPIEICMEICFADAPNQWNIYAHYAYVTFDRCGRCGDVKLLAYFALYLAAYHGILINFYKSVAHTHTRTIAEARCVCVIFHLGPLRQPTLSVLLWVCKIYCLLQR